MSVRFSGEPPTANDLQHLHRWLVGRTEGYATGAVHLPEPGSFHLPTRFVRRTAIRHYAPRAE